MVKGEDGMTVSDKEAKEAMKTIRRYCKQQGNKQCDPRCIFYSPASSFFDNLCLLKKLPNPKYWKIKG